MWGKQERCTADSHPSGAVGLNQAASQGEHEDEDDEDERETKTKTLVSGGTSGREEQRVEGASSERELEEDALGEKRKNRTGRLPEPLGMWSCAGSALCL